MPRQSKKEMILDAAESILEKQSYGDLSLDRIAEVSGLSKGGLLYHFPTKDSVLIALVERLISNFDNEFDRYIQKGLTDFRAISLLVNTNPKMISTARGLMAVSSYNRDLIEPLKKAYARWDKVIFAQFSDENEAWRFRLFFDGLFFCSLLNLPQPTKKELKNIVDGFKTK
jgi:AcrR family transcriptional regulator